MENERSLQVGVHVYMIYIYFIINRFRNIIMVLCDTTTFFCSPLFRIRKSHGRLAAEV
jgi:hypothetical protein